MMPKRSCFVASCATRDSVAGPRDPNACLHEGVAEVVRLLLDELHLATLRRLRCRGPCWRRHRRHVQGAPAFRQRASRQESGCGQVVAGKKCPEPGVISAGENSVAADLLELASLPLSTRASSTVPRMAPIMAALMLRPRCLRSTRTPQRPSNWQFERLSGVKLLDSA